ncbi:hypothetical protein AVEN_89532-1 [Araneus ventricosus]|uniref:Uncharacterized protein n=1 Tax=Araneus ventricosus TaxID=182803 RepID=A0A4Y2KKJ5_ARAVE|nr:hypothetical protein AVEN_89532-1 [Araneus ventricosus]
MSQIQTEDIYSFQGVLEKERENQDSSSSITIQHSSEENQTLGSKNLDNITVDTPTAELFAQLRSIINGGKSSFGSDKKLKYRAYLNYELSAKANKLVDSLEFKFHIFPPTSQNKEHQSFNQPKVMKENGTQADLHHPLAGSAASSSQAKKETHVLLAKQPKQQTETSQPLSKTTTQNRNPSYADKVKASSKKPKTILLYQSGSKSGTDLAQILSKETNLAKTIKLKDVRRINNGIAVDCKSNEDIDAILAEIENQPKLKEAIIPKKVRQVFPRCIVYGLSPDSTKEEVQNNLQSNFPNEQEDLKVLFPIN